MLVSKADINDDVIVTLAALLGIVYALIRKDKSQIILFAAFLLMGVRFWIRDLAGDPIGLPGTLSSICWYGFWVLASLSIVLQLRKNVLKDKNQTSLPTSAP